MLFEQLTGIADPYVAFAVIFACIVGTLWVFDLYGIINIAAWFGLSSGDGGSGEGGDFGGGGDGGE